MIWVGAAVTLWCAVLCWFDIRERRLPNALTLPVAAQALVAAAVGAAFGDPGALIGAGLWTAVNGIAFALRGMGAGDVKLAPSLGALVGAVAGAPQVLVAVIAAQLITVVWAILARDRSVPHGPAMCVAALGVTAIHFRW